VKPTSQQQNEKEKKEIARRGKGVARNSGFLYVTQTGKKTLSEKPLNRHQHRER
jgi:hypothetical protein